MAWVLFLALEIPYSVGTAKKKKIPTTKLAQYSALSLKENLLHKAQVRNGYLTKGFFEETEIKTQ